MTYGFANRGNGYPATMAIVFQSPGSNATQIIEDCLQVVDKIKTDLPKGLTMEVPMNNNEFLYASIDNVIHTLIEAFVLVFVVVYIFLQDFRSTIIPAIAIPVALIGTFFVLKIIGFSLNLITLSALVLAIAIVVDDAIVVVGLSELCGLRNNAHRAGESVRAFTAEKPMATAIVMPNCW